MEENKVITKEMFDRAYVGEDVWVRCDTKEKSRELLHLAHGFGYRWANGDLYICGEEWSWIYGKDTVYNIYTGRYSSVGYEVKEKGKVVIDYASLIKRHPQEKDIEIKHEYF